MKSGTLVVIAILLIGAVGAFITWQAVPGGVVRAADELWPQDDAFITFARGFLHTQDAAAGMALTRSRNVNLKQYVSEIRDEHAASLRMLNVLVARTGGSFEAPHIDDTVEIFGDRTGPAFDREYVRFVIDTHLHAIQRCEQEIKLGGNAELMEYAAFLRSRAQHHLDGAVRVARGVSQF
jgi:predicted outer membrane protein